MKTNAILATILALTIALPNASIAQLARVKSFNMTVSGTSTMHEWESVVEKLECKTSYKTEQNTLLEIKEAIVKLPVESIKSPKGRIMDNKTYEAFNYEDYPAIIFTLTSCKINAASETADIKGKLSMAGTTRPIDLRVTYKLSSSGDLQITGSKKIKMTEYLIEPPTAMMGAIKVGDEVSLNFEVTLTNGHTIL